MKRTLMLFSLGAALALSAAAQTYYQPVRDVNAETRQPVTGYCVIQWSNAIGVSSCSLYTVPAGKRLAVRDVSFRCSSSNTASVALGKLDGAGAAQALVLLQQIPDNSTTGKQFAGARPVFLHVNSGNLNATAWLTQDANENPGCEASFQGFLVDLQ